MTVRKSRVCCSPAAADVLWRNAHDAANATGLALLHRLSRSIGIDSTDIVLCRRSRAVRERARQHPLLVQERPQPDRRSLLRYLRRPSHRLRRARRQLLGADRRRMDAGSRQGDHPRGRQSGRRGRGLVRQARRQRHHQLLRAGGWRVRIDFKTSWDRYALHHIPRHARACRGHPRLSSVAGRKTWMRNNSALPSCVH